MKKLPIVFLFPLVFLLSDDITGTYTGQREDFITTLKIYDDSVFSWSVSEEWPFEVSEGNWRTSGDTLILESTPCKDPEALKHHPVRTYVMFRNVRFLIQKGSLTPLDKKGRQKKEEVMMKAE